jgi:hypothetical protein
MTHGPELVPLQAYMAAKCEVCVCDCQSKIDALQAEVEELKGAAETGNNAFRSMAAVAAGWKDRALAAEARVKELIDADAGRNALLDKAEARVEAMVFCLSELLLCLDAIAVAMTPDITRSTEAIRAAKVQLRGDGP